METLQALPMSLILGAIGVLILIYNYRTLKKLGSVWAILKEVFGNYFTWSGILLGIVLAVLGIYNVMRFLLNN